MLVTGKAIQGYRSSPTEDAPAAERQFWRVQCEWDRGGGMGAKYDWQITFGA